MALGPNSGPQGFDQDFELRVRVFRGRLILTAAVGGSTYLGLGWVLGLLRSSPGLEGNLLIIGLAWGVVVLAGSLLIGKQAHHLTPGRLLLTPDGLGFQSHDLDSLGSYLEWEAIGKVIRFSDWELRRVGAETLVVLPLGQVHWRRPVFRGNFGKASMVVSWLRRNDAQVVEQLIARRTGR